MNTVLNVFQTVLVRDTYILKTPVSNYTWRSGKFCSSAHLNFRLARSKMWFYTNILLLQDFAPSRPPWQSFTLSLCGCRSNGTRAQEKCYIQHLQAFHFSQLEENIRRVAFDQNRCLVQLLDTLIGCSRVDWNKRFSSETLKNMSLQKRSFLRLLAFNMKKRLRIKASCFCLRFCKQKTRECDIIGFSRFVLLRKRVFLDDICFERYFRCCSSLERNIK